MVNSICRYCALFSAIAFTCGSIATAGIRWGNLDIDPYATLGESYDSNIYLDPNNEQQSWITAFVPGVNFFLPVKKHEFRLNYQAEIIRYDNNPGENDTINNKVDALANLNFPSGLYAAVNDYYRGTTDPLNSELVGRVRRNQNTIYTMAGYQFSRFLSANVSFSQTLYDYIPQEYKPLENRRENEGDIELAYAYSKKTSALLDYAYGTVDYAYATNNNDSWYNQLRVGLRGTLTPKTIGEIKIGAKDKKYVDISGRDVTLSVLSLATTTDFSKRTSLNLIASRNFVESIFFDNLYYIETSLQGKLSQKLYRNWTAMLTAYYGLNAYPETVTVMNETKKRDDTVILAGLNVTYTALDWLFLNINYTSRQRNSNFSVYYYLDHIISLSAKVYY